MPLLKKNEVYATAIQLMHYLTSRQESKFEQPKKMLKIIASRAKSGIEKNGWQHQVALRARLEQLQIEKVGLEADFKKW